MISFIRRLFEKKTGTNKKETRIISEVKNDENPKQVTKAETINSSLPTQEVNHSSKIGTEQKGFSPSREMYMKKFLIAGLGNIGPKYAHTRHNIGFKVLDHLAEKEDLTWETAKLGDIATFKKKGRIFILLKPSTFMNLSGKAVHYWLEKEKIPVENLLVITDDLNLAFGTIRIKGQGSSGGHNGLKDIQQTFNSGKYPRFRFGISDDFSKGRQVDYVLGEWTPEEESTLKERLEKAAQIIESFGLAGLNITMNTFNNK